MGPITCHATIKNRLFQNQVFIIETFKLNNNISRCNGNEQYSVCCGSKAPVIPDKPRPNKCKASPALADPRTGCCGIDGSQGNRIKGMIKTLM